MLDIVLTLGAAGLVSGDPGGLSRDGLFDREPIDWGWISLETTAGRVLVGSVETDMVELPACTERSNDG